MVSPLYVKKQYTMFELDGFLKHKSGSGSDARRNILMVLKRPVPEEQYPQAIRGIGYIPFFEIDREKGQDEPYFKGYASTAPSDKYWDAIREVAKNLQQFFAEMADRAAAKQRQQAASPRAARPSIWRIPRTTSAMRAGASARSWKRRAAQSFRASRGRTIRAAAEQHLRDALARAQLSIHLLGATPGTDTSGLTDLARLQLDLAARARRGRRRLPPADLAAGSPERRRCGAERS